MSSVYLSVQAQSHTAGEGIPYFLDRALIQPINGTVSLKRQVMTLLWLWI